MDFNYKSTEFEVVDTLENNSQSYFGCLSFFTKVDNDYIYVMGLKI